MWAFPPTGDVHNVCFQANTINVRLPDRSQCEPSTLSGPLGQILQAARHKYSASNVAMEVTVMAGPIEIGTAKIVALRNIFIVA